LGGNADGFLKNLEALITQYPDETRYIPAHGREYTKEALRYYHNAFVETFTPIKKELDRGKTIQQIVESSIFNDYRDWLRKEDWVEVLQKQKSLKILPSVCEPLTQMIMEKDIDEALKTYKKIKMEAQDKFLITEDQLNTLGYQLLERKMIKEAISIFTLNTEEYQNSSNVYDSLGEAYRIQGNAECAEANFKKALQLDPNNVYAKEHLKQLHEKKH
jgi:tetratricopeptide (TPR) repeat protein